MCHHSSFVVLVAGAEPGNCRWLLGFSLLTLHKKHEERSQRHASRTDELPGREHTSDTRKCQSRGYLTGLK